LPYSLDDDLIKNVEKILYVLVDYQPTELSITHGDLHSHNVLVKGDELILFDKFADFPVAPVAFGIGLLYAESLAALPILRWDLVPMSSNASFGPLLMVTDLYLPSSRKWLDHFTFL
jgi:hypothetical protein